MRPLRGFALLMVLALLAAVPAAADVSAYYQHRGLCGLAAVGIKLFGYAEVVEIGVGFGAPRSEVVGFIAWCGSRGVGGDDTGSAGPEKRECTFSSDCRSCSGSDVVENSCINYKCVPPPGVEARCALQSTAAGSYTFPNTCVGSGPAAACGKDTAAIRAKLDDLQQQKDKLKSDLATLESENTRLNAVFQKAVNACLNGAAAVTAKLIVDTAVLASGFKAEAEVAGAISRFYGMVVTDTTGRAIDEAAKKIGVTSAPTDTQQEFWQNMCVLQKSIKEVDMPLWDRKFLDLKSKADALVADIQALNAAL